MGKNKSKQMYLITGAEKGWKWRLSFSVSQKQRKWEGSFDFDKAGKYYKTLYLASGREEGCSWSLHLNISAKDQYNWLASFSLANETTKYKDKRRNTDRYFAKKTFPLEWKQQFEIHHVWEGGETCYFLTPEEHRAIHQL